MTIGAYSLLCGDRLIFGVQRAVLKSHLMKTPPITILATMFLGLSSVSINGNLMAKNANNCSVKADELGKLWPPQPENPIMRGKHYFDEGPPWYKEEKFSIARKSYFTEKNEIAWKISKSRECVEFFLKTGDLIENPPQHEYIAVENIYLWRGRVRDTTHSDGYVFLTARF